MNEEEEAFIRRFIVRNKRDRYLGFLSKPNLRRKFLRELYHTLAIDGSLAIELPNRDHTPERVEELLRDEGAGPDAYVISTSAKLDQSWMPLSMALDSIFDSSSEAIVCCRTGELAYYKSGDSAWILHLTDAMRVE